MKNTIQLAMSARATLSRATLCGAVLLLTGSPAQALSPVAPAPVAGQDAPKSPAPPSSAKKRPIADPATNARLQLKLDAEDREPLARGVQFSLPEPVGDLQWLGSQPLAPESLRGRVIVIQSLSVKNNWRSAIDPLRRQLKDLDSPAVVIVLHTPEGADRASKILEPVLDGWIAVIDTSGEWCDALGIRKRPVNLIVDRNGIVRYAGLTPEGIRAAVEILQAEEADPGAPAKPRPESVVDAGTAFPVFREPVGSATDQRGRPMPALEVESWITRAPDPSGRLVVIDFWATWCPPCRASIPHMNEIASRFENEACFVGISNESKSNFEEGCRKHNLKERDFKYALALDTKGRLQQFFGVRGIPHCAVMSSDGVVRWQGMPSGLTDQVMRTLVTANKAMTAGGSSGRSWKATGGSKRGGEGKSSPPAKRKSY